MKQNDRAIEITVGEANERRMKTQVDLMFSSWPETCFAVQELSRNNIPFNGPFHGRTSTFLVRIPFRTEVSMTDLIQVMDSTSDVTIYVLYLSAYEGRAFLSFLEDKKVLSKRKETEWGRAVVVVWTRPEKQQG